MYKISNDDRDALLGLLRLTDSMRPNDLVAFNHLRRARLALKRLQRKEPEQ